MYEQQAPRYFPLRGIEIALPHEAADGLMVDREDAGEGQLLVVIGVLFAWSASKPVVVLVQQKR
jgi:hypothetical protein